VPLSERRYRQDLQDTHLHHRKDRRRNVLDAEDAKVLIPHCVNPDARCAVRRLQFFERDIP
jgi:hypothetical protein